MAGFFIGLVVAGFLSLAITFALDLDGGWAFAVGMFCGLVGTALGLAWGS